VALLILNMAPPGRCWSCASPTDGWSAICAWCGEDVRNPPEVAIAEPAPIPTPAALTVIEGSAPPRPPATERTRKGTAATAEAANAASNRSSVEAADPVHQLKARLGPASAPTIASAGPAPDAANPPVEAPRELVLASAIYLTGSRGLQAGSRYGIALMGPNLAILGPVDIDPSAVALTHHLRGLDATGIQGQLIITAADPSHDRFALVFMAVAGGSCEGIADVIAAAAAAASEPSSKASSGR